MGHFKAWMQNVRTAYARPRPVPIPPPTILCYSVRQVAKLCNVTTQTVRRWIKSGKLQAQVPGIRNFRITQAELERFLASSPSALAGVDLPTV